MDQEIKNIIADEFENSKDEIVELVPAVVRAYRVYGSLGLAIARRIPRAKWHDLLDRALDFLHSEKCRVEAEMLFDSIEQSSDEVAGDLDEFIQGLRDEESSPVGEIAYVLSEDYRDFEFKGVVKEVTDRQVVLEDDGLLKVFPKNARIVDYDGDPLFEDA